MTQDMENFEEADYFFPNERTILFIDGNNLYQSARGLGVSIDFNRLRAYFKYRCGPITRAYYYTALPNPNKSTQTTRHLANWLSHNGYSVVSKEIREYTSGRGERVQKGNLDVDIAVDCMELIPYMDHAILFSGDSDFLPLVHALKRKGIRVTVVSTRKTPTPAISDEFRMAADGYIDIFAIREHVQSEPTWTTDATKPWGFVEDIHEPQRHGQNHTENDTSTSSIKTNKFTTPV